jgi:hypothetical protein
MPLSQLSVPRRGAEMGLYFGRPPAVVGRRSVRSPHAVQTRGLDLAGYVVRRVWIRICGGGYFLSLLLGSYAREHFNSLAHRCNIWSGAIAHFACVSNKEEVQVTRRRQTRRRQRYA